MAWTTPKTWAVGDPLTADVLNEQVRDNLNGLRNPARVTALVNDSSFTTTSSTFVDVDATDFVLTLDTDGGDIMVGFQGKIVLPHNTAIFFTVAMDGTDVTPSNSSINSLRKWTSGETWELPIGFVFIIENVSAGTHILKLRWRKEHDNTPTLDCSGSDAAQFWAQEIF